MFRQVLAGIFLLGALAGCGKSSDITAHADSTQSGASTIKGSGGTAVLSGSASKPSLLISSEDVFTIRSNALASGPSITGSVQPEKRADLRAEVSAVVLQVLKDNGDAVHRGDLLVRLDDTAIRDGLNSAEASARAAGQAYDQSERQYQRLIKLREAGMVSTQAVEDVEIRRDSAQSDFEAAKTRTVIARQQLQRTESRAPFDGIVSDRKVSAGDTAQVGKELVKVIDPHSMRFEGMVSADNIGQVKVGQEVVFRIHGFADEQFLGKITRVNPAANATTRQVEVLVSFTDVAQQPGMAGLYAEGRVATGGAANLMLPSSAVVKEGEQMFAWRVKNNALQKIKLGLGERDARSGDFELKEGLSDGDLLLRHPGSALIDGQKVEMATNATSSAGAS